MLEAATIQLKGKQKAALLLMGLDAPTAGELLKGLDSQTVQELALELAYLDASGYRGQADRSFSPASCMSPASISAPIGCS